MYSSLIVGGTAWQVTVCYLRQDSNITHTAIIVATLNGVVTPKPYFNDARTATGINVALSLSCTSETSAVNIKPTSTSRQGFTQRAVQKYLDSLNPRLRCIYSTYERKNFSSVTSLDSQISPTWLKPCQ